MRYRWIVPAWILVSACAAPSGSDGDEAATYGQSLTQERAADTTPAPTLTFTADWKETATPLVAGEEARVSYDPARLPECRGQLGYGGNEPSWSIDGFYMVNGINFNAPLGVAGASLLDEHLPPGALPAFTLLFAGTLQMWFENGDAFGCNTWDSDYGNDFSFPVAPPANAPGWVGNASVLIDRATCGAGNAPCYADARPAADGATYGTWARQRAAIAQIFFDAWKSGVTDFDNPDLWRELDVEAHMRLDPAATFTMQYVNFAERTGNDARYAIDLRALDPLGGVNGGALTSAGQCPAMPATITADGLLVQVDMEIYFTVNGVAVQPATGGTFHVLFQNDAGLYAVCSYPRAA